MYILKAVKYMRHYATQRQPKSLVKLKKMQEDMQAKDGSPVFLKKGASDRLLYNTTLLAALTGLVLSLSFIYDKAKPPSWDIPPVKPSGADPSGLSNSGDLEPCDPVTSENSPSEEEIVPPEDVAEVEDEYEPC